MSGKLSQGKLQLYVPGSIREESRDSFRLNGDGEVQFGGLCWPDDC